MKLTVRFAIVAGVVALGLAIQGILFAHLTAAPEITPGKLSNVLASFPNELDGWRGQDLEIDEESQYASDHFKRVYVDDEGRQQLVLWMVFSDIGEDRKHFPEICLQTHGQNEDLSGQALIEVEGHPKPVQQHRFGNGEFNQYVYYWHYTIPHKEAEGLTSLQRTFQEIRNRRASITLQVFAQEMSSDTTALAIEFVKLADEAIQDFVGPDAVRGCERRPVTLIEE